MRFEALSVIQNDLQKKLEELSDRISIAQEQEKKDPNIAIENRRIEERIKELKRHPLREGMRAIGISGFFLMLAEAITFGLFTVCWIRMMIYPRLQFSFHVWFVIPAYVLRIIRRINETLKIEDKYLWITTRIYSVFCTVALFLSGGLAVLSKLFNNYHNWFAFLCASVAVFMEVSDIVLRLFKSGYDIMSKDRPNMRYKKIVEKSLGLGMRVASLAQIVIIVLIVVVSYKEGLLYQNQYYNVISAGDNHTLAIKDRLNEGKVLSTGNNDYGQCDTDGYTDVWEISAKSNISSLLFYDGTVVSLGKGAHEEFEDDTDNWLNVNQIATSDVGTIGLKSDGSLYLPKAYQKSWGNLSDIKSVWAGNAAAVYAIQKNGNIFCIGGNGPLSPYDEDEIKDVVKCAYGGNHSVLLKKNGKVLAANVYYSQISKNGEYGECDVENWDHIIDIAAGYGFTVGLKSDGTVVATGKNDCGQCDVSDWEKVIAIEAGYNHTVGLCADGTVLACGKNDYGQCNVSGWNVFTNDADDSLEAEASEQTSMEESQNSQDRDTVSWDKEATAYTLKELEKKGEKTNNTEKEGVNENTSSGDDFNILDWPLDTSSLSINDDYRKSITKKETPISFPLRDQNVDDSYDQFLDSIRRNPIIGEMMIRALKASHEEDVFFRTYPWIDQFITIIDKQREEGTGLNIWLRRNGYTDEHFITEEYHSFSLNLCNLLDQADKSFDDIYGIPYVLYTDELNSQRHAMLGDSTTEEKALVFILPDGVEIGISLKDQAAILPLK